jgi:hypothetical protein
MKPRTYLLFFVVALFLTAGPLSLPGVAQEDTYVFEYAEVFGSLSRAPVSFDHSAHMERLEKEGCGACHHVVDKDSGKLEYVEGEESTCSECHSAQKNGSTPGLREAFHGKCTGCHRQMSKHHQKTGPVTCGECHKKP